MGDYGVENLAARTGTCSEDAASDEPFVLLPPDLNKAQTVAHAAQLCRVEISKVVDLLPCTPLQEGLIALTTIRPGDYVSKFTYEIGSDVDVERLHGAFDTVAHRNAILRTRIISLPTAKGNVLLQVVLDVPLSWTTDNNDGVHGESQHRVGLSEPLTRLSVTTDSRRLVWKIHHALYDGWSLGLLLEEIEQAYHQKPMHGLRPVQHFIRYLQERDKGAERAFWCRYFQDTQAIHFPSVPLGSHSRPNSQMTFHIPDLFWSRHDYTAATILKAAWAVVVANETGTDEALFGLTVTGRQAPLDGIDLVAGPTIATVPLRIPLNWKSNYNDTLKTVQSGAAEMIPFEQTGLHQISQLSENAGLGCKFQSLLVIQPKVGTESSSLRSDLLNEVIDAEARSTSDTYPVVIECQPDTDGVHIRLAYDSTIVSQQRAEFVAASFTFALSQLSSNHLAGSQLQELRAESSDIHQVWTWNAKVPEPTRECIHDMISRRSLERPTSSAICAWDGSFTYGELEDFSTRLALHLTGHLLAGKVVPLLFEKSKWMPIAVVGVMKAGGVCLALDSEQPKARLRDLLAQSNATLILCSVKNSSLAQDIGATTQVVVGADSQWSTENTSCLPVVQPSDTLYINFTSGSTGVPKGAINTHEGFCSAITYQQQRLGFSSSSRVFDFASYAFDASWANCLHALTSGACLCIPSQHERDNDLAGCLDRYQVTSADFTPSVARIIGRDALSRLSTLILGGEAVVPEDATLAGAETSIFNVYGPAECTPTTTIAEIKQEGATIGRGAGVCTWVIDPDMQTVCPIGAAGELWLEGPLVGKGYLNDQERTAHSFVDDSPWLVRGIPGTFGRADKPGRRGRLYRTGDLVRYRPDGSLLYVGRMDTQVKIRGQRVELGEIEHYVRDSLPPHVAATVVAELLHPAGVKSAILVAFISLNDGRATAMSEEAHDAAVASATEGLSARLAQSIPSHLIPAAFIPQSSIPRSTSDKVERKALRKLGEDNIAKHLKAGSDKSEGAAIQPVSHTESILQQIWMSVLNLSKTEVSIDKPFTRLGGDSITAMQVVAQGKLRNISFTVTDILEALTIRKVARRCKTTVKQAQLPKDDNVGKVEVDEKAFDLSPIQQMFFDAHPEGLNHWNQSFLLELSRPVAKDVLSNALKALLARHAMLRCRFHKDERTGKWTQRVLLVTVGQESPVRTHQINTREQAISICQARQKSLDLQAGPVFTCDLFQVCSDESQLLLLSSHHAIIDLVSWRIVWTDLEDFICHGKLLSHPTASFQQWCAQQAVVGANLSPLSVLPFAVPQTHGDFWGLPESENTLAGCESHSLSFERDVTSALFGQANEAFRTEPIDIIVAALVHSFTQTFPQREPAVVWLEGHGREQSDEICLDATNTIGWFTTLYPLPLPVSNESTIVEAVCFAKDNRRRLPKNGQPYFSCRYHSESGRELFQQHGLPEILLNFSGQFQQLEAAEGLFKRPEGLAASDDIEEMSPAAKRSAMIEVSAERDGEQLLFTFYIHKSMKHQDKLKKWIASFSHTLTMATQVLTNSYPSFTPTDVPLLSLSHSGLKTLLEEQLPVGILPKDVVDMYPCLPTQEGILLSVLKGSASYQTPTIWRCVSSQQAPQSVSTLRLEEAWVTVVKRHAILQTIFVGHPEGKGFVQVVLRQPVIRVAHSDASNGSPQDTLAQLESPIFAPCEAQHLFSICQSSSGEVACRLDIQHSLIDAASLGLLIKELTHAYDNIQMDSAPAFRDVVHHVASIPEAQRLSAWAKLLQNTKPCLFPIEPSQNDGGDSEQRFSYLSLPVSAVKGVAECCKSLDATRFVFIQVAWALVLSHFTGQTDVCFGYLAHGRDAAVEGIESMVGPLINLLVGRVDLRQSTVDALRNTSQNTAKHRGIQYTSLADIQHHLGVTARLFNTSLSVRGRDVEESPGSLTFQAQSGEDMHEFDMGLSVAMAGDTMEVVMEYRQSAVPDHAAKEAVHVLTQAIQYLLKTTDDDGVTTSHEHGGLAAAFFEDFVGSDEASVRSFWVEQFTDFQAAHYPPATSSHPTEPYDEVELDIMDSGTLGNTEFNMDIVVRTAWALLACRMTGSHDVVFGVTATHDTNSYGALPMRVIVDMQETVIDLLQQVESRSDSASRVGRTSRHWLRSLSEGAQSACEVQAVLQTLVEAADAAEPQAGNTWIRFMLRPQGHVTARMRFQRGVLTKGQAERSLRQLQHIISQLADKSLREKTLGSVDLTSSPDLEQIWEWNSTVPEASKSCLQDLIAVQVRAQSSAPCVCAWDGELSYGQLDTLSTQLATDLLDGGVAPGSAVLLLFEKSIWMPVAAMAVMKSGAAAVATDATTQPEQRLRAMVDQTQASTCLSSVKYKDLASRLCGSVVVVGQEMLHSSSRLPERQLPVVSPSDTLYIQFTSGSTGVPKGVMVTHENMCSALIYQREALGYRQTSRVLDFSSYAFDVFWSNLSNTLTSGACLCIASEDERQNDLSGALAKYKVNFADLTPSIARHTSGLDQLSTLILGGEVVLSSDRKLVGTQGSVRNAYGPAECTPTATILALEADAVGGSIGRPAGLCAWIVSPDNPAQLSSIGAPGELWLEGPLVSKGYVGDNEKTSQSFIDDPDWLSRGVTNGSTGRRGRLYRTGDLVRYHEDGSIIFIGRKDNMVKIRGQRVELEEVEHVVQAALQSVSVQEHFKSAEVIAEAVRPKDSDADRLVAFVALGEPGDDHDATVRRAASSVLGEIAAELPAYMIPWAFVPTRHIPRQASGKLDRRQLRGMGAQSTAKELSHDLGRAHDDEQCLPRTDTEKLLQRLWAEILKLDPKSIVLNNSFFRLGGDSIGAMRLVALARQDGVQLTVRQVFQQPVLTDLASTIDVAASA